MSKSSPLLSLYISSLLLSTMIKIKILPLKKKKKLLHSSTYHYETQIWIRSLIALGCFWGESGDYSFWLAIFQIQLYPYIKIISFEFCHCFCSSVCNILTKCGHFSLHHIYKDHIFWVLPLFLFFSLQYSHQTWIIFSASHPSKPMTGLQIYAQSYQLLFSKSKNIMHKWW